MTPREQAAFNAGVEALGIFTPNAKRPVGSASCSEHQQRDGTMSTTDGRSSCR